MTFMLYCIFLDRWKNPHSEVNTNYDLFQPELHDEHKYEDNECMYEVDVNLYMYTTGKKKALRN